MSVDPKVFELAQYFMADRQPADPNSENAKRYAEDVAELATDIQDTVEMFFAAIEDVAEVE